MIPPLVGKVESKARPPVAGGDDPGSVAALCERRRPLQTAATIPAGLDAAGYN
jgi:hypothetical protein